MSVIRKLADLLSLLADNVTGEVSPSDSRDVLVSTKSGYGAYEDLITKTTPLAGLAATPLQITCDSQGANGNEEQLPFGVTAPLWDSIANRVDLSQLVLNEQGFIRVNFAITTSANNTLASLKYNFYDSLGDFVFDLSVDLPEIKAIGTKSFSMAQPFFIGDDIENGTAELTIQANANFSLVVGGVLVSVIR